MSNKYIFETDDKNEFLYAVHGLDFLLVMHEFDQWLRAEAKYGYNNYSEEELELLRKVRGEFLDMLDARGLSLDMLS